MLQQFDKAAALFEEVHLELNYFEFLTHKIIVLPISLLVFRLVRIHLRVHYWSMEQKIIFSKLQSAISAKVQRKLRLVVATLMESDNITLSQS